MMRDEVSILFLYSYRVGEFGTIFSLAIQMTPQMKLYLVSSILEVYWLVNQLFRKI